MANFRTHVTSSALLGVAYGAAGHLAYEMPLPTSCVAGGLLAIGGILPDMDSDNAVVLRESLAFIAAVTPMLLMQRFQEWGWTTETIVFSSGILYLLIRFCGGKVLRHVTVHRGMWHSIPAAAIAAVVTYLSCSCLTPETRWFKTGGMFVGYLWHLLLDEINSIESTSPVRVRVKRSFGSALKFFGRSTYANLMVYGVLAFLATTIYLQPGATWQSGNFAGAWQWLRTIKPQQVNTHGPTTTVPDGRRTPMNGPTGLPFPHQSVPHPNDLPQSYPYGQQSTRQPEPTHWRYR